MLCGIHEQYSRGDIDKDVARVLLGDKIDQMQEEKEAFESAMERDFTSFLADWYVTIRSAFDNPLLRLIHATEISRRYRMML